MWPIWIKLTVTWTKCKYILILRELTGELNSEIGTSYVMLSFLGNLDTNFTHIGISRSGFGNSSILMGLLQLRYEYDSTTIRLRFGYNTLRDAYDSTTIRARYNILRGVMCFRAIMNMSILSRCSLRILCLHVFGAFVRNRSLLRNSHIMNTKSW